MRTKILVVDDSASDRLIIQRMLSDYSVLPACDGLEAMRLIEEHEDIDLIILDLKMPNMDGFAVLDALKSDTRHKRLRTIILTNYEELENEIRGLRMGAVDYIRKPINMHSLRARIEVHTELLRIQRALEQTVTEQKRTFDTVFHQAAVGIAISFDSEGMPVEEADCVSINPMFEQITGRTRGELIKLGWASITHPDDRVEDLENYRRLKSGEISSYTIDKRLVKPDGSVVWVHWDIARLAVSGDRRFNHICLVHDITEHKRMEKALIESERSKSVLLSHLPGLAYRCLYDRDWTMTYVSAGCFKLTGYPAENLLYNRDLSFNDLIAPEYREELWEEWKRILADRRPFKYEYEIITASGERKWVLEMGEGIFNDAGEVEALEGIIIDITDRKAIESTLKYNSEHDRLTGLYNRSYLEGLLKSDAKKRLAQNRAVVSVNLSATQSLTRAYGFHYTHDLIRSIVDALSALTTSNRTLFSIDDNHLAFYLRGYSGEEELTDFCEAVAGALEPLLRAEGIDGGIGVLEIDRGDEYDVDQIMKDLLAASERAMDTVERDIGICYYDADIEAQIMREQEIKHELTRIAVGADDGCLFLQYQPILDLKTNEICGFEALARLNSERLGIVQPGEFIPIAEKTKLIDLIGRRVVVEAFRFINKLKALGHDNTCVSINVSVFQLLRHDFCKELLETMREMGVSPENVGIEITESAFSWDFEALNRILLELRDAGLHVAIDDFGTGYSSLARERELNVNCLKLDKYFVDKLMYLEPEEAITGDVVSMAHRLGHCVVAEGVEHERQRQCLQDYGCDKIQGYLVSGPLSEDEALELLRQQGECRQSPAV